MYRFLKKYVFFVLLFTLVLKGYSQQQKTRIVIVPYSRFDFKSDHSLQEIASYNQWDSQSLVYTNYIGTLINALSEGTDSLSLFALPESEVDYIKRRVPKVYKKEPVTHNGIDLERLKASGKLSSILENLSADYILFLVDYEIKAKIQKTNKKIEGQIFVGWAYHTLTYELYDKTGELVAVDDGFKFEPHLPTKENYLSKGTSLAEVQEDYPNLLKELSVKLKLHKKRGEAIFEKEKYSRSTR